MRAQAHATHRRGASHAAAVQKGTPRWMAHLLGAYHTMTWRRVAQAVGSALLCGALAMLTVIAGLG